MSSYLGLKQEWLTQLPQDVLDGLGAIAAHDLSKPVQGAIDAGDVDAGEATEVELEFRRFLALILMKRKDVFSSEPLAPTAKIDRLWHAFIIYTQDYLDFTNSVMGGYVHHVPEPPNVTGDQMRTLLTTYFEPVDIGDIWSGEPILCWEV